MRVTARMMWFLEEDCNKYLNTSVQLFLYNTENHPFSSVSLSEYNNELAEEMHSELGMPEDFSDEEKDPFLTPKASSPKEERKLGEKFKFNDSDIDSEEDF